MANYIGKLWTRLPRRRQWHTQHKYGQKKKPRKLIGHARDNVKILLDAAEYLRGQNDVEQAANSSDL